MTKRLEVDAFKAAARETHVDVELDVQSALLRLLTTNLSGASRLHIPGDPLSPPPNLSFLHEYDLGEGLGAVADNTQGMVNLWLFDTRSGNTTLRSGRAAQPLARFFMGADLKTYGCFYDENGEQEPRMAVEIGDTTEARSSLNGFVTRLEALPVQLVSEVA